MPQNDNPTSGNPYVKAFHDLMSTSKDFMGFLGDPGERQGIRQGVADAVNRGAVAATLGAPVDMANMGLNLGKAAVGYLGNKAGVLTADQMPQPTEKPFLGSEYFGDLMQRGGAVSPNRNALAETAANFLTFSPVKSAKAVAAIAGGGMVPGMDIAATVFHGSPHKFDRFDSNKIGTGEGAQAYGHGLYLAESPEVAKSYQAALTHSDDYVDGQLLDSTIPKHFLARVLSDESGNVAAARESLQGLARPGGSKSVAESARQALQLLESGQRPAMQTIKPEGSLYKVDLPDEHINKMLDWDKPLSQQPAAAKHFKEMHELNGGQGYINSNGTYTALGVGSTDELKGKDLVNFLAKMGGGQTDASAILRQQGIPGIRYLDGGSRGTGAGTSNYVVFPGEENMLRILERNGQVVAPTSNIAKNNRPKIVATFLDNSEYENPKYITPVHEVRDTKKLQNLTESMQKNGWQGRPILAYDVGRGPEALTGSHRIAAARAAGIKKIPVMYVDKDVGDYLDKNGKSIEDASFFEEKELQKWLSNFGDKNAANLLKFERNGQVLK